MFISSIAIVSRQIRVLTVLSFAAVLSSGFGQAVGAAEDTGPVSAPVVKGDDAPSYDVAFWTESGETKVARGDAAANAPDSATTINVKVLDLGKRQMFREITIRQGDAFAPPKGRDALIYVLSGKLDVKLGDGVRATLGPGDAYRKVASQNNLYTAIEETVIVETDAPSNLDE